MSNNTRAEEGKSKTEQFTKYLSDVFEPNLKVEMTKYVNEFLDIPLRVNVLITPTSNHKPNIL